MTIEEMRERKRELGYSNRALSEITGIPEPTLQKIFSGSTKSPRRETLEKLSSALLPSPLSVREQSAQYGRRSDNPPSNAYDGNAARNMEKKNGGYTLEDYLALPEEERVELIDGVFYDMAAPTTIHQAIAGYVHRTLLNHVLSKGGSCMPFISPVDVQLDQDDKTVVQPDVMINCDRSRYKNGRIFGAPDFILEVLSPSTKAKDLYLKLYKYKNAGVREYWIVDPVRKTVTVYDLANDSTPEVYSTESRVPVLIWNRECEVDFGAMYEFISFLYET